MICRGKTRPECRLEAGNKLPAGVPMVMDLMYLYKYIGEV